MKRIMALIMASLILCGCNQNKPVETTVTTTAVITEEKEFQPDFISDGVLENGIEYDIWLYEDGESVEITDYTGTEKNVVIPETINGVPVKKISTFCCYNNEVIESLVIPDSVTEIYGCAFAGCDNLKSVTLPKYPEIFDGTTFKYTPFYDELIKSLGNEPYISNGVLVFAKHVTGDYVVPDTVKSISQSAFSGGKITSVTIPESITFLDRYAFSCCDNLVSVALPETIEFIGRDCFEGCDLLESINIPESVTEIEEYAFGRTKWLENRQSENPIVIVNNILIDGSAATGEVVIPKGVDIVSHCFYGNENITKVTIPEGITEIPENCFYECTALEEVILPESVTLIDSFAFNGCTALKKVNITENVEDIYYGAFYSCPSLAEITIPKHLDVSWFATHNLGKNYSYEGAEYETTIYQGAAIYKYSSETNELVQVNQSAEK